MTHKEVTEMMFAEYQESTGKKLYPFTGRDGKAIKDLLAGLPELGMEELSGAWQRFLHTPDPWHQKHIGQDPVRWFCSSINCFLESDEDDWSVSDSGFPTWEEYLEIEKDRRKMLRAHGIEPRLVCVYCHRELDSMDELSRKAPIYCKVCTGEGDQNHQSADHS